MLKCAAYPHNTINGKDFLDRNFGLRFHFNGQEADDEIAGMGNIMSAEFWEYDTRLGRRWNRDPVVFAGISPYAVLNNNPISFVDPDGLQALGGDDPKGWKKKNKDGTYSDENAPPFKLNEVSINGGPKPTIVSKVLGWIGRALNNIGNVINKVGTWLSNPLNSAYFAAGAVNAFSSDHMLGAGSYNMQGSDSYASAHKGGQTFGHAAAAVAGAIEFGGGTALTVTSGGTTAPASVPLAIYGSAVTGVATANLIKGIVSDVVNIVHGDKDGGGSDDDGSMDKEGITTNQLQKKVEKGQAPNSIDRFDKGNPNHNEADHVHFKSGDALYKNGKWKHGGRKLNNKEKEFLKDTGWSLPKE